MIQSESARFLHVANGTSTTGTIEAAGIPGPTSIWADPLYEGPVPGGLNDEELVDVRARHLDGPPDDPVNDLRRWRRTIANHDRYDELVLWYEHDLFDQLNLIQLLSWIQERLPPSKAVSLVCIGAFPGRPGFKGLGELTKDELASLVETRQRVSHPQYVLAERAWRAFRDTTPEALVTLLRQDTSALPFLAAALNRFLEEYPSTTDGLSRTERRFLQLAAAGPADLAAAFPRMHDGETAYYITDLSFAALVESFSRSSPPLTAVTPGKRTDGGFPHGTMTITDAGRAVLNGQRDWLALAGVDRWLGGVHLRSGGDMWRWDAERREIRRSIG